MKKKINVGFITTVSGRWPRELPEKRIKEYGDYLEKNMPYANIVKYKELVSSKDSVKDCISEFKKAEIDIMIMVYGAFTGDDVCCTFADELKVPIVLWAPREETWEREDRLYANALCSATMNGASLKRIGADYRIVFGNVDEERVQKQVDDIVSAYAAVKNIKGLTFGLLGYRPTAFYNCSFDEITIRRTFGINIEETDLKVVFDMMEAIPQEEVNAEIENTKKLWDTNALPEGYLDNHVRLYLTLKKLAPMQGYDYSAIKCWPEMGALKTTPCAVLGRLADEGIPVNCEGDVDAGLAAVIQNILTDTPAFITDLINIDEKENTVTYWHCGNAAPSLHNCADGVKMCDHPLAGQGTAFYCSLKTGPVTAARLTNLNGKYVMFILGGEAVPTERCTRGSMVNVKVETPVLELVDKIAESGMSHHYSVIWADVADKMAEIAKILGIEVIKL